MPNVFTSRLIHDIILTVKEITDMKYLLEVEEAYAAGRIKWHRSYDRVADGLTACSDQVHRLVTKTCEENNWGREAELEYRDECSQVKDTEKSVFFMADPHDKYYVRLSREE